MKSIHLKKTLPIILLIIVSGLLLAAITWKKGKSGTTDNNSTSLTATLKGEARPLPIYGINGNNSKGPAWTNKAFRDTAASIRFRMIRYPGGTISDFWDWKAGWFVDSKSDRKLETDPVMMNNLIKYQKTPHSPSSIRELKLLVDETNCSVLFTLNMLTRSLDDQIAMLKNAESMGIPVKWVELGNEYNIKRSAGREKYPEPEIYGDSCKAWISVIKQNFPDAKVAIIGGNKPYSPDVKNWNNEVLREASNADAIVAHIYPLPGTFIDKDGINFQRLYTAFKQRVRQEGFDNVSKNIWVTEFNVQWSVVKGNDAGEKNQVRQNAFTWAHALGVLLMTSEASEIGNGPAIIIDHNISNSSVFAAIETEKRTIQKLPNGIGYSAWCKASYDKTSMRKISFGSSVNDYEVMGWEFTNNKEASNLIVNFTANPVSINISSLSNNSSNYELQYAGRNAVITGSKDVHRERKPIEQNTIKLPAYSIATF